MFALGFFLMRWVVGGGGEPPPPVPTNRIMSETGDRLLAENGDYLNWE